jgi:hypothetical protein
MNLSIGTHVSEHGYRIGQLSGVEVDRESHVVRHILVRGTNASAPPERRAFTAVPKDHFTGDIALLPHPAETVGGAEPLPLTGTTRVLKGGRLLGRLSSLELNPATGAIVAITGRQHWWNRAFHARGDELDFSPLGEIRVVRAPRAA